MKSTGIIRRVDDFGRVVIPKDVRKAVKIKENDPLEIFVDGDMVVFSKYSASGELGRTLQKAKDLIKDTPFPYLSEERASAILEKLEEIEKML